MNDSIYNKDCTKMRLQNLHPYDSAVVGLDGIYFVDYKGDFHINAPFIIATNKTIRTGSTYILIYSSNSKKGIMHPIVLQDAYYDDGTIYCIIRDIKSQVTFSINQYIKCPQKPYKWILIDLNYFTDKINAKAIQSYCGKCNDNSGNSIDDSKSKQSLDDDLLEFEF
jgi:hypothetical protein